MGAAGNGGISISIGSQANTAGVQQMEAGLRQLQNQVQQTASGIASSMNATGRSVSQFGQLFDSFAQGMAAHSRIGGTLFGVSQFFQSFADGPVAGLTKGLGLLGGAFGAVLGAGEAMIGGIVQIVSAFGVMDIFNQLTSKVRELGQEMITLNETMQKQDVGWAYLFGNTSGPNYGAASQMLSFTASQSYNMPYTRQDMNESVRTLSMLGLTEQDIEHYMPILADLGVRNPQIGLAQIAQAILGAQMGMPRMLKYELAIPDQALIPYGLDMNSARSIDPATLLPALENYARAMGYYNPTTNGDRGAAYNLARNTFMGATTSFQDRYQNFLLQLGGSVWGDPNNAAGSGWVRNQLYNSADPKSQQYIFKQQMQAGDIRQNSIFDLMIKGLNGITDWWDAHQKDMNALSDLFGNLLGQGMKNAEQALLGFVHGLQQAQITDQILQGVQGLIAWLSDPSNQARLEHLGVILGTEIGNTLKDVWTHAKELGSAWGNLMEAFGNGDKAQGAANMIGALGNAIDWAMDRMASFLNMWADLIKMFQAISRGDWGAALADAEAASMNLGDFGTAGIAPAIGAAIANAAQQQGVAAATNAATSPVNNRPTPSRPAGGYAAGSILSGGGGGGTSISWGGSTNTVYVFGADSRTVQQIVDNSSSAQAVDTMLAVRRPGANRFGRPGLY